jgi:hypothetical protein
MEATREIVLLFVVERLLSARRNKDKRYTHMLDRAINVITPQELMIHPIIMEMAASEGVTRRMA